MAEETILLHPLASCTHMGLAHGTPYVLNLGKYIDKHERVQVEHKIKERVLRDAL